MQFNVDDDYKYAKEITPDELNEAHAKICNGLRELRMKKGHDYGQVFEFTIADYGLLSPVMRFRDKLGRLENLLKVKESKVEDESIRDTILDLGNYCILTCAVLDLIEQKKKDSEVECIEDVDSKNDFNDVKLVYASDDSINSDSKTILECKG